MKKTALITGASSGIGKELAYIHAEKKGNLIIVARSSGALNELKAELEDKFRVNVSVITKDLTQPNAAQEIYDQVSSDNLQLDFLINNAGFGGQGKFYERDWSEDLAMIQLNIIALTSLTRKFLPDMVNRNQGKILNVSSTASLIPGPLQAVYFATKAYVTSFSNAIAEELSGTGITVSALLPGATDTGFADTAGMNSSKLFENAFSAKEVAEAGYKGMIEGELDIFAGLTLSQKIMMKMIPFIPKKMGMKQIRKMQETSK